MTTRHTCEAERSKIKQEKGNEMITLPIQESRITRFIFLW